MNNNNLSGKEAYEQKKLEKMKKKGQGAIISPKQASRTGLWMGVILIIVLVVAGMAWLLSQPRIGDNLEAISAVNENDYVKGNPEAKTVLVEYSDFQCPSCATYYPVVKDIVNQAEEHLLFVYRHYPLPQHQNAELAALSAEAAGRQDKFWEMHDLLFENQPAWSDLSSDKALEVFTAYAETIGLNVAQFTEDLDSSELKSKVSSNIAEGGAAGVTGTPTFFLNGEKITNPRSFEDFVKTIEDEINANNSTATTTEQVQN